jgi:hypothetical protein
MSRDALLSQMKGPAYTPQPLPQANGVDTGLNLVGYAGLAKNAWELYKGN